MDALVVHPRIAERHPSISPDDVESAWINAVEFAPRTADASVFIALGMDSKGRLLEMVARHVESAWIVYHALTPPTKKFLKELSEGGS